MLSCRCADPKVYSVPMLLVIGWRGEPGKKDEPQHQVQGRVTPHLLRELAIPYEVLPDYDSGMEDAVSNAYRYPHERHSAPLARGGVLVGWGRAVAG